MDDRRRHEHDRVLARRAYVISIVALVLGAFGFAVSLAHIVATTA